MMMWSSGAGGWVGCWVMVLVVIAFLALLITGLMALGRYALSASRDIGGTTSLGPGSADDILAQRYARGDIDGGEYRRRLEFVRQTSQRDGF